VPPTILVIEDNRDGMALIDHLLTAHGYAPLLASSGLEGLLIAMNERPDVILLDMWMPGMDGYEVAAAIRRHPELNHTRIVAVTASAMVGDRDGITAAGFDGYIPKPINPETFIAQVKRFFPKQHLEQQLGALAQ
jgi:CheY-like chemotaxis protein